MRRKLPPTFPLRVILILSLILCLCGVGTVILAVFSVKHRTWGYNWGTGFWCGTVTFAAGVCGIISTHARNICSMKAFMISAVFGGVISLVMLALSAGGLDSNSGLYADKYKSNQMTVIVHGGCLGISILQLILFILADGICIYFLFVEKKTTLFSLKTTPGNKPSPVIHRESSRRSNSSDSSRTPIYKKPKSKSKNKKKKQKLSAHSDNIDDLETPLRETRDRGSLLAPRRQQALPSSSPVRNHNGRNSFTTFGHSSGAEQESLIVHPDDDVSTLSSTARNCQHTSTHPENHYAQGLLFEHPIPIEDDDHLPPYEVVDSNPYNVANLPTADTRGSRKRNANNSEKREDNSLSSSKEFSTQGGQMNKQKHRINTRNEIPHARGDSIRDLTPNNATETLSTEKEPVYATVMPRRSRSADLLSEESESASAVKNQVHSQGVILRDFSRSGIKSRSQRSQSLRSVRPNREKRLERRNRALSAEIKLTKDLLLYQEEQCNLMQRTTSFDDTRSGLYASNRLMPTKFSLRTPVRQVGAPCVPSAVPIRSISSLPIFKPPPKPPRTHSVTVEDLKSDNDDSVSNDKRTSDHDPETSEVPNCIFIDEGDPEDSAFENSNELLPFENIVTETADVTYCQKQTNGNSINNEQFNENLKDSTKQISAANYNTHSKSNDMKSGMVLQKGPIVSCLTKSPSTKQTAVGNGGSKLNAETTKATQNEIDVQQQNSISFDSTLVVKSNNLAADMKEEEKIHVPVPKARTSIKLSNNSSESSDSAFKKSLQDKEDLNDDSRSAVYHNKTKEKNEQSLLNKDDFGILKVNLPPLKNLSVGSVSPSLRIINRKMPMRESDNKIGQRHEITNAVVENVHVAIKDSPDIIVSRLQSTEYKGARPKTIPRKSCSVTDKSRVLPFSNKTYTNKDSSSAMKGDTRPDLPSKSNQSVSKHATIARPYISSRSPEVSLNRPVSLNRSGPELNSNSPGLSTNLTSSVRTSSNAAAAGYSQGVLHLPQTQFSRQVSTSGTETSGINTANNNGHANVQNQGNPQNTSTDRLLISKLL